ncbi:MAG: hydantoinase/oxoprolinase family protein [Actinomycetota bacterium]|nr:MAG: hydantoinase/oxoprolinase family protein [Actinomycetota bacterium]
MSTIERKLYTADFDIGGTFTDGFFTDGTLAHRAKVFTTPHDLTEGFLGCLQLGAEAFGESLNGFLGFTHVVRLSTTLGTNTLLQRRGPKVGLIVTAGSEANLYAPDGNPGAFESILDPRFVRGLNEAVDETGKESVFPPSSEVLTAVRELLEMGARIIAVSLRNSWRNPIHEKRVREIVLERYPVHYMRSVPLQLAHEITSSDDDHSRTNTVVLNAYLHRDLSRGLYKADDLARQNGMRHPLLVVNAAGGSARVAKTVAVQTMSSGPAVAVRGAAIIAKQLKLDHVVCADMGGTSLDVAVIDGAEPSLVEMPEIHGMKIAVPVISTESIGAGGGSIARVVDGKLRVGPDSAGSVPGPACYGKGGQNPTVTDANLVLGLIEPANFLGGRMRLDLDRAREVLAKRIGAPLGVDVESAAAMIRACVNTTMADEIRKRIDLSATSPSQYAFFAFGGGGMLHACDIAEEAGITKVVGFPFGSVFSAFGSSTVDVWHRYPRSLALQIDNPWSESVLINTVEGLLTQGRLDMKGEGFEEPELSESFQLVVETADGREDFVFKSIHDVPGIYDAVRTSHPGSELREVVFDIRAEMPTWLPAPGYAGPGEMPGSTVRKVRWSKDGPAVATPVFKLENLGKGSSMSGPALIETKDTVFAVKSGWSSRIDQFGNIVMESNSSSGEGQLIDR